MPPPLRKKDYLKTEYAELNRMVSVLADKIRAVQSSTHGALISVDRLEQQIVKSGNPVGSEKEAIDALRKQLEAIQHVAGFFTLQGERNG